MDPITIISAVASAAKIVDLLSRTIGTIREMHHQWDDADLELMGFLGQLTALKAALTKIAEWMDAMEEEQYHQLIMDLETSLTTSRVLIEKVDDHVSEMRRGDSGLLTGKSRVKLLFGSSRMDVVQKMIDRQTNALMLLLTVCNSKALSEQKVLLQKPSTRRELSKLKEYAASLMVQRDESSSMSRFTDTGSKLSVVFDFDRDLFISQVYERFNRRLVKQTIRKLPKDGKYDLQIAMPPPDTTTLPDATDNEMGVGKPQSLLDTPSIVASSKKSDSEHSHEIDLAIHEDRKAFYRESHVLMLGLPCPVKDAVLGRILFPHDQHKNVPEELLSYRDTVRVSVRLHASAVVQALQRLDIQSRRKTDWQCYEVLSQYKMHSDLSTTIDRVVADALELLRNEPCLSELMNRPDIDFLNSAMYFLEHAKRITAADYEPTTEDVSRATTARLGSAGTTKLRMEIGGLPVYVHDLDPRLVSGRRNKWMHHFDNLTSIVFVVDLACYDCVSTKSSENLPGNELLQSLAMFDTVVNSPWFARSSVVLILANVHMFRVKLATTPLQDFFPDYTGGSEDNKAAQYITQRFNQLNRGQKDLYPRLTNTGEGTAEFVRTKFLHTIIRNNLKLLN